MFSVLGTVDGGENYIARGVDQRLQQKYQEEQNDNEESDIKLNIQQNVNYDT